MDHEQIVKLESSFQVDNQFYILLDFLPNSMLYFYMRPGHGLGEELSLKIICQVVLAIKYIHKQGIVHRDIKPENLLFDDKFRVLLCDFGWATNIEKEEMKRSLCGTMEYMSPEVVFEQGHDSKVDTWAIGVLLFELLHGYTPFKGDGIESLQ